MCSDAQLRETLIRSAAIAWIGGQDLAKLFSFCNGWSPVAFQAAITSVPSHIFLPQGVVNELYLVILPDFFLQIDMIGYGHPETMNRTASLATVYYS